MNTAELKELQEQATELGVMSDWERGFLSDVINRGKRLSSKQMNIVSRIVSKVERYDESKIPQWVKTLQSAIADEKYHMNDWNKRFVSDMIQRGMTGRDLESFSQKQQDMVNMHLFEIEKFMSNRDEIIAKREQEAIERAERRAAEEAARLERERLEKQIISEEGYGRIAALIDAARGQIKFPTITVKVNDQSVTFKAAERSQDTMVQSNHKKSAHRFGIISHEGTFTFNGLLSPELREVIKTVNEDPLKAVIEFGHSSGSCSFCRKDLTDMRSVSVGYGPICAKRYSLPWGDVSIQRMTEFMVAKAQSVRSLANDEDESLKTTQSIKCDCCDKYVLHPDDYAKQSRKGYADYYCNNGCEEPVFDVKSEKCSARFVVETPAEIVDAYKQAFGITGSLDEKESDEMQAFDEIEQVEEAPEPSDAIEEESVTETQEEASEAVSVDSQQKPDDGLFWTKCGRSFKSRQGRYNFCKRTGAEYL